MPYKTWAPFERLLSDDMNGYLSNQVAAIFSTTAQRDLAIPSPIIGQPAYITATHRLTRWDGAAWVEEPRALRAEIKQTATQTIVTATPTVPTLSTVVYDIGGFTGTSGELLVPTDGNGFYLIIGTVFWQNQGATPTGKRELAIRNQRNSSTLAMTDTAPVANQQVSQSVSALVNLIATDRVALNATHTQGANLDSIVAGELGGRLTLIRLGQT